MPNSLRSKISKLRYKGQITEEEYKELIAKLDGHDREVKPRWIPVSERLPEEYGMYLVTKATRKTELEKGYKNDVRLCVETYTRKSHWGKSTCGNVAWMPLPEPYKEVTDAT